MRRASEVFGAAFVAVAIVACGGDDGDPSVEVDRGTVVQHVTVVDTRQGMLLADANVVIDGGVIQRVTTERIRVHGSATAIDATGRFLVPGYNDLHTHASNAPGDFAVLLANGVTGVREASGSPALLQAVRQQNAAVVAGTFAGPEVLTMPSMIFAGQSATDAGARQFVRDRLAEGADFVKVTGGGRDAFLAVVDEARRQGSHAAGHLTPAVSAVESSNAGYRSFEHLGSGMGLVLDCASDEAAIRASVLAKRLPPPSDAINPRLYDGNALAPEYQRVLDTYDEARCRSLARTFLRNDTWQAVTLIRLRTQDLGDDPLYRTDPNLQYVDRTRRALWESIAQQYATTVTPAARATLRDYYALQLRVVRLMKQEGVNILAGSDLGGGLVVPGFSLHQEFRELAAAGLTPLEVLQATTLNGARFLGREATMGTVEAGRNADLVLLDANPLADVANLDRISAVFLKGRHFPRAALDRLLAETSAGYAMQPLKALSTALDPTHPD